LLTACEQDQDVRFEPARKLSANLYDIYHCCVYSEKTPDDGQKNCPKHVEFHSKNKIKLVHLVGFIIRIYHDARSPQRQIHCSYKCCYNLSAFSVSTSDFEKVSLLFQAISCHSSPLLIVTLPEHMMLVFITVMRR